MNLLYPRLTLRQFGGMMMFGLAGSLIAGAYGILHDQITFRLGPEYFTKFKIEQFYYLDRTAPIHLTVAKIGFLATWWVGMFAGWFMGRVTLPHEPVKVAAPRCLLGVGVMILTALQLAFLGWLWAPISSDDLRLQNWTDMLHLYDIHDRVAFIQVGYIHNASYLGGLIGLMGVLVWLRLTQVRKT